MLQTMPQWSSNCHQMLWTKCYRPYLLTNLPPTSGTDLKKPQDLRHKQRSQKKKNMDQSYMIRGFQGFHALKPLITPSNTAHESLGTGNIIELLTTDWGFQDPGFSGNLINFFFYPSHRYTTIGKPIFTSLMSLYMLVDIWGQSS